MEQYNTPLYTAMKKYIEDKAMAFHTPGHKQGKGAANAGRQGPGRIPEKIWGRSVQTAAGGIIQPGGVPAESHCPEI